MLKHELTSEVTQMCQTSNVSVYKSTAMTNVQTADPESLIIRAFLRSQRSTSTPEKGATTRCGTVLKSAINASGVTDPVSKNTHTPSAKPVNPDPIKETSCPAQMIINIFMLFAETFCAIFLTCYRGM